VVDPGALLTPGELDTGQEPGIWGPVRGLQAMGLLSVSVSVSVSINVSVNAQRLSRECVFLRYLDSIEAVAGNC
jgi:hypothetical protein